jgi:hypothetical protein
MSDFRAGDIVYWIFKNGDKALCTVNELHGDRMWVTWHKDNFVNLMPKSGFILAEKY